MPIGEEEGRSAWAGARDARGVRMGGRSAQPGRGGCGRFDLLRWGEEWSVERPRAEQIQRQRMTTWSLGSAEGISFGKTLTHTEEDSSVVEDEIEFELLGNLARPFSGLE